MCCWNMHELHSFFYSKKTEDEKERAVKKNCPFFFVVGFSYIMQVFVGQEHPPLSDLE